MDTLRIANEHTIRRMYTRKRSDDYNLLKLKKEFWTKFHHNTPDVCINSNRQIEAAEVSNYMLERGETERRIAVST